MLKRLDVGIAGAGFAGAATALFLAERGHRVTLYEEAARPEPVGAGILMQPSGLSVLSDLGLLDGALARGSRVEALECVTPAGRRILDLRYRDLEPTWFGLGMHRGALFQLLHEQLPARGVTLRTGVSVRRCVRRGRSIRPVASDGRELGEHELLVAADGARSTLRRELPGARAEPYGWGALWFVARDPDAVFAGKLWQVADGTETLLGFLPCGLGPRRAGAEQTLGTREGGSGDAELVSLFWSVPTRAFAGSDFDLERWKERVLALEPRAGGVLAQIESPRQLLPAGYFDVRLPRFHAERLVLVGDAAHATSPQLGQGVNLALEDARVLAACVSGCRDLQRGLDCFSRARAAHVRYYRRASWGLTPFFQSSLGGLGALRDACFGPLCRFPPTRRLMLATLSGVQRSFLGATVPLRPIRARIP